MKVNGQLHGPCALTSKRDVGVGAHRIGRRKGSGTDAELVENRNAFCRCCMIPGHQNLNLLNKVQDVSVELHRKYK
jgi:hypothetical protein